MGSLAPVLAAVGGCASVGPPGPVAAAPARQPRPTPTPSTLPSLGASDVEFIDRLTWGFDSAAAAAFASAGSRHEYLQSQLHPGRASAALPGSVQARIDTLALHGKSMSDWVHELADQRRALPTTGDDEAGKAARQAYQRQLTALARDAATRSLLLALYSPNQLQEQMTWFWFNHFNVHQQKGVLRAMVGDYEQHLRRHALGRFEDLLIASATHPAMLRYLDNAQNAVGRLNENYAREVMELHTLGVDGGYSQRDVQELARVLTGLGVDNEDAARRMPRTGALPPFMSSAAAWRRPPASSPVEWRENGAAFEPRRHDMGDKLVLGTRVLGGRGIDEITEQLRRLARHPATARRVSRKLAAWFVADAPPDALVDAMARRFVATDGHIAEVLQTMFESEPFEASLQPGAARPFKAPIHYVVSAVRLVADGREVVNAAPMIGWLNRLGQGLYNRQTPDGYPLDEASWSNSGQMATRFEIARAITGGPGTALFRDEAEADARTAAAVGGAPMAAPMGSVDSPNGGASATTIATAPDMATRGMNGGGPVTAVAPVAPSPPPPRPAIPPATVPPALLAALQPTLGERTRAAIAEAASPQERSFLLLASPDFMAR